MAIEPPGASDRPREPRPVPLPVEGYSPDGRDRYIASLLHDFRSPLGAISMSTEVLLDFELDEKGRYYHLAVIQRAAARLNRLIQDLLDVERIENGSLELMRERQDVVRLLTEVCTEALPRFESRSVALNGSHGQEETFAIVDGVWLAQAVHHLLDHALQRSRAGSEVALRTSVAGGAVRIEIEDRGECLSGSERSDLFDRFAHLRGGGAMLGVGMAIARGVVEEHGGSIEARPGADGRGTNLVVSLPLDAPYIGRAD